MQISLPNLVLTKIPTTPAFVLDHAGIDANLQQLQALRAASGCKLLYAIKALPLATVLDWAGSCVDGFAVNSLFEARWAAGHLPAPEGLHLTTPGLRAEEMSDIGAYCGVVNFNSLSQFNKLAPLLPSACSSGLRVNPKLSFLSDNRFNPCGPHSKLGVDIEELRTQGIPGAIEGLHVHNIFASTSLRPLQQTMAKIRQCLEPQLSRLRWLNLGGGYLFQHCTDLESFTRLVAGLKQDYGLEIFIEPGKAVVGNAGFLVATVLDCFLSDGEQVAVLDSSVNHHPELFEYQRSAELAYPPNGEGDHMVILAGCTCLAGDVFGTFRLRQPLTAGDKVVFRNLGAYSLVKANRFNGYNLPDIYACDGGEFTLLKRYSYEEYSAQWQAPILNSG